MVRCILPFLATAFAEESLMQFEKAGELNVDLAKGQYSGMFHSAQDLTNSYKALLTKIMQNGATDPVTGETYVPPLTILDKVRSQFTDVEGQLEEQQRLNQGILDTHEQSIRDCNANMESAFTRGDGVVARMEAMQSARTAHGTCRDSEDVAISEMEDECDKFKNLDRCKIEDQNWYAVSNENGGYRNSLDDVIAQGTTCRTKVGVVSTLAPQCDTKQATFQTAFCKYEDLLTATCSALDNCYATNTGNKAKADSSIKKLEEEQKTMYRMVQKVHCYLDALFAFAKDGKNPVQAQIDACELLTPSDKTLDITYEVAADKVPCADDSRVKGEPATDDYGPGADDWYTNEMSDYELHGKLTPVEAC